MSISKKNVKRVGSAVAVGAVTSIAVLGAAAPASAATAPGELTVCSKGSYATSVVFPDRGDMSTVVVPSGDCLTIDGFRPVPGKDAESINVFGHQSPSKFWIASGHYAANRGGTVTTFGTSAHPWASTPA